MILLIITSETVKEIFKFKQYSCAFFEYSMVVNNNENSIRILEILTGGHAVGLMLFGGQ